METHDKILSAIRELAGFQPMEVKINLRGSDVVCMDAHGIEAYFV